ERSGGDRFGALTAWFLQSQHRQMDQQILLVRARQRFGRYFYHDLSVLLPRLHIGVCERYLVGCSCCWPERFFAACVLSPQKTQHSLSFCPGNSKITELNARVL